MIIDIFECFYEQFQLWLASCGPLPAANANPSESKEGWRE